MSAQAACSRELPQPKFLLGDEDLRARVARVVEDEGRVGLAGVGAVLDAAPVVEEEVAVAGALDALEELLGDDLVGVDVGQRQGDGGGGEDVDGDHRVLIEAKS